METCQKVGNARYEIPSQIQAKICNSIFVGITTSGSGACLYSNFASNIELFNIIAANASCSVDGGFLYSEKLLSLKSSQCCFTNTTARNGATYFLRNNDFKSHIRDGFATQILIVSGFNCVAVAKGSYSKCSCLNISNSKVQGEGSGLALACINNEVSFIISDRLTGTSVNSFHSYSQPTLHTSRNCIFLRNVVRGNTVTPYFIPCLFLQKQAEGKVIDCIFYNNELNGNPLFGTSLDGSFEMIMGCRFSDASFTLPALIETNNHFSILSPPKIHEPFCNTTQVLKQRILKLAKAISILLYSYL